MAKLEDQVTPIELLNIIRGGAIKKEVLKQFRTTEQELAKMLLPLYRSGELTMEEFNDFFKGLPLKPKEDGKEGSPAAPRPEDEAPSEILRSLSEGRGRSVPEEAKKPVPFPPEMKLEKPPAAVASPEPPMASVESAIVEEIEADELFEEGELEDEFVEEPDIEMESELQTEAEVKEAEEPLPPKPVTPPQPLPVEKKVAPLPPRRAPLAPASATEESKPDAQPASDMAAVQQALSTIVAKLSSMEGILARIEKNLRKP